MSDNFKALSLISLLVDEDNGVTTAQEQNLGFTMLKKNTAFATFASRMQGVGRSYFIREKGNGKIRSIQAPGNFENVESCGGWLNVCFKEYLAQKRKYEARAPARKKYAVGLVVIFTFLAALLYFRWPLWNVLIDLEVEEHYKVLGITDASSPTEIKKAYRQQIKRWHPDQNPHCTDHCRIMTMKIQHAHDVLLSRGDHRFEIANQYKKELLQLRSFVFFRIYSIAANAGGEISVLIQRMLNVNLDASREFKLRIACVLGAMLFFAAYESFFVAGLDLTTILSFFAYCVSVVKVSAEAVAVSSLTKTAYVDCLREAVYFVAPVVIVHIGQILLWGITVSKAEEISAMVFGILYLLAFLYNFSPNLMDNVAMGKFSLPMWSIDGQSARFSRTTFLLAQMGFLVNDLFVFTCRIPTVYRVVAYVLNFMYLSEFVLLPWEAPMRKRNTASTPPPLFEAADAPKKKQHVANASPTTGEEDTQQSHMNLKLHEGKGVTIVPKPLDESEVLLLQQLDSEGVEWLDIASNKYKLILVATAKDAIIRLKQRFKHVTLCYASDMVSVMVCVQSTSEATGSMEVAVTAAVHDPICSQLIAIETGPGSMLPEKKMRNSFTAAFATTTYDTKLKEKALLTLSELYRRRTVKKDVPKSSNGWPSFTAGITVLLLLSLMCALCCPTERDATRLTKGFPAHQRVLLLARYTDFAPLTSIVNYLPAGLLLLRKTSFILFTTDVWEMLH
ncbi:hypothetical protein STCU_09269 [Strigomonas culicis]|uniref:J domain-containing protein n=1 Tax=Strigomonas culicis TaxID=28005 RepID=S9TNI3_9TRYP|nr:hypothetical protein STCU_09269 [Strigomonas culicis]|eukprot:EPY19842.1 hypothetical protein STCU_09269 [Strigomonas culicis]